MFPVSQSHEARRRFLVEGEEEIVSFTFDLPFSRETGISNVFYVRIENDDTDEILWESATNDPRGIGQALVDVLRRHTKPGLFMKHRNESV